MTTNSYELDGLVAKYRYLSSAGYQASLKIDTTEDGCTMVSFNVNLGVLPPPMMIPPPPQMNRNSCNGVSRQQKVQKRKKSPSQLARDKKRAQLYHAKKASDNGIVLPFSGQLLPVTDVALAVVDYVDVVEVNSADNDVSTPAENIPPQQLEPFTPMKTGLKVKPNLIDDLSKRKVLFPDGSCSPSIRNCDENGIRQDDTQSQKNSGTPLYQKKEDLLWSKLFD